MRARKLELKLASMGAVGAADIDARNRKLRELNLLPTGGRGPHAPQIDAEHAAWMLLGLASSSVAAEAAEAAKKYAKFIAPRCPEAGTLLKRLTEILSEADRAAGIAEVRVCRTRPWAMIVGVDGQRVTYHPRTLKLDWAIYDPGDQGTSGGREEYVIGSGLLQQIAIDLSGVQGAKWDE